MKITVVSSRSVEPAYGAGRSAAWAGVVPLSVFDEVNHDEYIPGIFAFHPPAPPSALLEAGLAKMLAEYREWAGRLRPRADASGGREIVLNDAGARFVEATADVALATVMPIPMGPDAQKLHPSCDGADELMLVQVTRFPCGSYVAGYIIHHSVADGYATCTSMLAWGQATRGVPFDPVPVHDRASFFLPRSPPHVEFEHRGAEFKPRGHKVSAAHDDNDDGEEEVVIQRVHFSRDFISRLKTQASATAAPRPYSALQCVTAHLWRCVAVARGLDGHEITTMHIAVDGRRRMASPRMPAGYTGNAVLWARPTTTVRELLDMPLASAAKLVSRAVARVDDRYFRSFIDFASSGAAEREGLVRTAFSPELVMRANLEVDSLVGFPFYDMDFGTGKAFFFIPGYSTRRPVEGAAFLVPPFSGDGGMDAYVPLYRRAVDAFTACCYSLMPLVDARL